MSSKKRCLWCEGSELYQNYHDKEWGVPLYDDKKLFEFFCLEGAQAGLSWITILKKREAYRKAFDDFNAEKIARYSDKKIQKLLLNKEIVRNKLKVSGFVKNAQAYLNMKDNGESFKNYFWNFLDNKPIQNKWKESAQVPSKTIISEMISKDLKKRGFTFAGPIIVYAFMQATGMVNDHLTSCFRHKEVFEI